MLGIARKYAHSRCRDVDPVHRVPRIVREAPADFGTRLENGDVDGVRVARREMESDRCPGHAAADNGD
jgi:hypothetical protein